MPSTVLSSGVIVVSLNRYGPCFPGVMTFVRETKNQRIILKDIELQIEVSALKEENMVL